jgi:hypothetical protein
VPGDRGDNPTILVTGTVRTNRGHHDVCTPVVGDDDFPRNTSVLLAIKRIELVPYGVGGT